MGAWSTSITGNDTARDLLSEYTVAFYYYGITEAPKKIDEYVRGIFDESDAEEWCDYYYSLADFMWKKGILTDTVRNTAVNMIDCEFGLEIWAESGDKILQKRKKVLAAFKEKLLSPMPDKKKIKPNIHTSTIFETGDVIAVQLQTAGKPYTESNVKNMSEDAFHDLDGKYILIQKIRDTSSWKSSVVPEIHDYWATFRLFDGVYDTVPESIDIDTLKDARIAKFNGTTPLFLCESSISYFKRRKYKVIDCNPSSTQAYSDVDTEHIFFSINKPWYNSDSLFLASMGKEIHFFQTAVLTDELKDIIRNANRWGRFNYSLSREENECIYETQELKIIQEIEELLTSGGLIYGITYGIDIGLCTVLKNEIKSIFILGRYQNCGFGTELLRYADRQTDDKLFMTLNPEQKKLLHICNKISVSVKTGGK